jgi:hypothetical protein
VHHFKSLKLKVDLTCLSLIYLGKFEGVYRVFPQKFQERRIQFKLEQQIFPFLAAVYRTRIVIGHRKPLLHCLLGKFHFNQIVFYFNLAFFKCNSLKEMQNTETSLFAFLKKMLRNLWLCLQSSAI